MCLFCEMAAGKIPYFKVYEDDSFLAFLDISPISEGHTILIPKQHYDNFMMLPLSVNQKLNEAVKKVLELLKTKLNFKGANVLTNIGEVSGQSVFHCHIHIIPRYAKEELIFSRKTDPNPHPLDEIKKVHEKLTK